ncbi:hypothetical protein JW926_05900 [Candidatus Sumerlaeota bacterium]|nr:hypothetical protein [Candidatus Sumerlaeota bacterium]
MEKTAYAILIVVAIIWIVATIIGFIAAFPLGIIGLVAILGFGLLFIKALRERMAKTKDDRYSRDVEK